MQACVCIGLSRKQQTNYPIHPSNEIINYIEDARKTEVNLVILRFMISSVWITGLNSAHFVPASQMR
jgi:hypothetical protein